MNPIEGKNACVRCGLSSGHPLAHLDASGACSLCRRAEPATVHELRRLEASARMEDLFAGVRERKGTHALLAYSGGKDSSWTLLQLRRRFGLSVRAVTVDNAYLSPLALQNAAELAASLDAEHVVVRPPLEQLRTVFRRCLVEDMFPPTALTRASAVCNACIAVVKSVCLREALAHRIPLVIWGWSPGQVPLSSAILHPSAVMLEQMIAQLHQPLLHVLGEQAKRWLALGDGLRSHPVLPTLVSPLALLPYDEREILRELATLGWRHPRDVDPNSTNCRLNAFAVEHHRERHGFHPYALELASLVRLGLLGADEAKRRIEERGDPRAVHAIAQELGVE